LADSDGKAPGFWFYPADHERDVQMLSLAAQGLWMRMLCWMSENEAHRGFLELPTGEPMTAADIGRKVGQPACRITPLLREMEHAGIFSVIRTKSTSVAQDSVADPPSTATMFNRRMLRDTHISEVRRKAAKSRYQRVVKATCEPFAKLISNAIAPAKTLQKASVTASVSVTTRMTDQRTSDTPVEQTENSPACSPAFYPETLRAIREAFPSTDDPFVMQLVESVNLKTEIDTPDLLTAEAVRECWKQDRKKQTSAGLFLQTVPQCLKTWLTQGRKSEIPKTPTVYDVIPGLREPKA